MLKNEEICCKRIVEFNGVLVYVYDCYCGVFTLEPPKPISDTWELLILKENGEIEMAPPENIRYWKCSFELTEVYIWNL